MSPNQQCVCAGCDKMTTSGFLIHHHIIIIILSLISQWSRDQREQACGEQRCGVSDQVIRCSKPVCY